MRRGHSLPPNRYRSSRAFTNTLVCKRVSASRGPFPIWEERLASRERPPRRQYHGKL